MEHAVKQAYSEYPEGLDMPSLYRYVSDKLEISEIEAFQMKKIGRSEVMRNTFHRKVRWVQQNLKNQGFLRHVRRGCWELCDGAKVELHSIAAGKKMIAMSTKLGVAIWGNSDDVFQNTFKGRIELCLTSPPYPLKVARAYGGIDVSDYVEFICDMLEPIIDKLIPGGNLALNVSNDIFDDGPGRSTYLEELVLAIKKRLGLTLMDRMPWESNKMPGPYQWASRTRQHLNWGYEHVYWFTNDAKSCISNNMRVLQPHSEAHKKFVANGGNKHDYVYADGAYTSRRVGSYSSETIGKIPRNILKFSNYCKSGREVNNYAKQIGLATHTAKMPYPLADFLVRFLSRKGGLVVDPFGGTLTTSEAAENNMRRWVSVERIWEYVRTSFVRFKDSDGLYINPEFLKASKTFH